METTTFGDMMGRYAELDQQIADLDAQATALRGERETAKQAIMEYLREQGQDKATACGLTASVLTKDRAKYDPAEWPNIVKWAVETGNDHIIQRRMTDAKVVELVRNGVALPWGLGVESYKEVRITKAK